eukprot:TRINITY_DN3191_c0_g1_i1.p1 TRINITY_DN3191_c0_g1~~TRINITY_DN3191_c0_g1_i1.p1  ORF type:complete len:278 (-),score=78.51 TRINITY_DN3191_c0_g1_i1:136-969(-)
MYARAARWRQLSEPNDPVWWVDRLPPESFDEGFGSHTPMLTGQTRVARYYPQFARAFALLKELMAAQCEGVRAEQLEHVSDCAAAYQVMQRDFYVVTPCRSVARPGHVMEGTRLTLQLSPPEGFEFSIRTPGTPARWVDYDAEIAASWARLRSAATGAPGGDAAVEAALALTFYWYNFMPLSRGTAAVGFVCLCAALLAATGRALGRGPPRGVQLDWEAILRPEPAEFAAVLRPWLREALTEPLDALRDVEAVADALPTVRDALAALNAAELLPLPQ